MDIEGATSLESLMGEPIVEQVSQHQQQQQQQQPMPPLAPPVNTCTQEANPGSPAVVNTTKSKDKKNKYSKDEIQKLALYVLVAAVVISLPTVQGKLQTFIPMLQNGGTNALILNGVLVAAAFYAILHFS